MGNLLWTQLPQETCLLASLEAVRGLSLRAEGVRCPCLFRFFWGLPDHPQVKTQPARCLLSGTICVGELSFCFCQETSCLASWTESRVNSPWRQRSSNAQALEGFSVHTQCQVQQKHHHWTHRKAIGCSVPAWESEQLEKESFNFMNIQHESIKVLLESSHLELPARATVTFLPKHLIGGLPFPLPRMFGNGLGFPYQPAKQRLFHPWALTKADINFCKKKKIGLIEGFQLQIFKVAIIIQDQWKWVNVLTQEVRKRIKSECPPFNLEGFNPCYLLFCLSFDALKKGVEISTAYSTAREAWRDQGAGEGSMVHC